MARFWDIVRGSFSVIIMLYVLLAVATVVSTVAAHFGIGL